MMFRLCLQLLFLRLQFFFQKSLKEEQTECIRRMVCLEDIIVVLPTGFGNSVYICTRSRTLYKKCIVPLPPSRKRLYRTCGEFFGIYSEATSRESKKC